MRVFSCFTRDGESPVPVLSFIFAADEERARILARRELAEQIGGKSVEIYEGDRRIGLVRALGGAA